MDHALLSAFSTLSGLLACRARSGGQTAARDLHAHAIKVPEEQLADARMTEGIHGGRDPMSDGKRIGLGQERHKVFQAAA